MLYVGTRHGVPERRTPDLTVEPIETARMAVVQWFAQPVVQLVGAHTGCSCGFPSVLGAGVIECYDGMFADADERAEDLRSVAALIELLRAALEEGGSVELYPVWDGDEDSAPSGVVQWTLRQLAPETLFFNEQFMYVVQSGEGAV